MFCRATDFHAVGGDAACRVHSGPPAVALNRRQACVAAGFREDLVLMEDADLCIRMHLAGPCSATGAGGLQAQALRCGSCTRCAGSRAPTGGSQGRVVRPQPACQCAGSARTSGHMLRSCAGSGRAGQRQRPPQWAVPSGWHCWGRVVQINEPPAHTSGRRMAALGNVRTTLLHFLLGLGWLCGASPGLLRAAVDRLYTDKHR